MWERMLLAIDQYAHGQVGVGDDGERARIACVLALVGESGFLRKVALAFVKRHGIVVAFCDANFVWGELDG